MRTWFQFLNASKDEATVTIFDEIGYWGMSAKAFIDELNKIEAKVLNVEINSIGGSVFDGIAIYNALKMSGKTINVKVMGVAASIASVIAMAGNKIIMPANAYMMVHSPMSGVFGNAEEMRDMADVLDKIEKSLLATYVKRTGKPEADIKAMLAKDTWLTAAECKDMGFADEVVDAVEASAKFELDRLPENVQKVFKSAAPAPTSAPTPAPTAAPAPAEAAKPIAEQITALAKAAGFTAHGGAWAVKFTKVEDAQARIAEAVEIKALCVAVNKTDLADGYIKAGKTSAEARTEIANKMADGDQHIDTTRNAGGAPPRNGPKAVTTASVWAAHNKQTKGV